MAADVTLQDFVRAVLANIDQNARDIESSARNYESQGIIPINGGQGDDYYTHWEDDTPLIPVPGGFYASEVHEDIETIHMDFISGMIGTPRDILIPGLAPVVSEDLNSWVWDHADDIREWIARSE